MTTPGRSDDHVSRAASALTGAAIGATAWLSLGVVALVDAERMTRLGALPNRWWLAALVSGGAAAGVAVRLRRDAWPPLALLVLPWLPWLPVRVPAAFLVWDGPLEGAAWLAAALGVLWHSRLRRGTGASSFAASWRAPERAPWLAAALTVAILGTAWAVARPRVPAGDEPHYLVIAQSLLRDGDLRIEDNHRDGQDPDYFEDVLKPDFVRRSVDREIYSIHAPGTSVVVLPAFALAGYPAAVATVVGVVALGVALVWRSALALTASPSAAWVAVLALVAAAPFVLHGFTVYPDPLGGTAAMAGVAALVALDTGRITVRPWQWLATGAALAALPWLHTRFAVLAGTLGAALAVRLWRRKEGARAVAYLLSVPVLAAAGWFAYFWVIYGTPNPAAPYGTRPSGGLAFVPAGIAGLLIDQQFGLVANAPVLGLALVGVVLLARRRPRLAVEGLAVVVLYLATAASYPMWWGGYSAPARFAVVVLPALVLPLAVAWAEGGALRVVIAVLLAVSAAITAALVGIDRGAFIYNGRDGRDLLLDWLSQTADLTLAMPSVHRDGPAAAAADVVVWGLAASFVVACLAGLARRAPTRAVPRALAWLGAPIALMVAVTVVWAAHAGTALSPAASQMWFLARWRPEVLPVAAQIAPTRTLAAADAPRRLSLSTAARGARPPGPQPLLQLPNLPAGTYDVFVDGRPPLAGTAVVRLGRQSVPMATWGLEGAPPGFAGLALSLPVGAHSITVTGDDAARASVRGLSLHPRTLAPRDGRRALRAGRYGTVVIFALDDNAYVEPEGVWVRGERTTSVVVAPDDGGRALLRLRAGPVANDVHVGAGSWRQTVVLAADASADLLLPPDALAPASVTVTSTRGFRPSAHGKSGDGRWLGVYLTWPGDARPAGAPGR